MPSSGCGGESPDDRGRSRSFVPEGAKRALSSSLRGSQVLGHEIPIDQLVEEGFEDAVAVSSGTCGLHLLVRALDTERARPAVDAILECEVSRFRLAEIEASSKGRGVLKYLVRLGKRVEPSTLEDALLERAAPNVIGARIH